MIAQTSGIQFMVQQMQNQPLGTREALRERAARLSETLSQRQIARELGVSRSTVFNLLKETQA